MYSQISQLPSPKAIKHCDMLAKHFKRKVAVEHDPDRNVDHYRALVHFPMGKCQMQASAGELQFHCQADSQAALDAVKSIIERHIYLLKEVRESQLIWTE
ncbi:MAG: DUF2218 domain-containing protein [Cellvibrionaceae bacterium]|nr:DUF2218 domain-containing protein [Cellvibrionaceae bacterium]MCV6626619.1 DUF2218 domain-containing protein [Cellvibrionaceae bacterium]